MPCTPPHILGVVNHRGWLLPILDLRKLFALAAHDVTAESRVVAVEVGGMTFGILADAVLVRFQMTFLATVSCPLSQRERVRVRGFCPCATGPLTPRPLPLGEGAKGASWSCPKRLLDDALGTMRVRAHEVMPPPVTLLHDQQAALRGVTGEMVAVLDLEALARDPRLTVDDEVA